MAVLSAPPGSPDTLPKLLAERAALHPPAVALREKEFGIWQRVDLGGLPGPRPRGLPGPRGAGADARRQGRHPLRELPGVGLRRAGGHVGGRRWASASTPPARPNEVQLRHRPLRGPLRGLRGPGAGGQGPRGGGRAARLERHIVVRRRRGCARYADPRLLSFEELERLGGERDAAEPGLFDELVAATAPGDRGLPHLHLGDHRLPQGGDDHPPERARPRPGPRPRPPASTPATRWSPTCRSATSPSRSSRCFLPLHLGMTVNFAESVRTIQEDLREIAPTVFLGVPRIWEKLQSSIQVKMQEAGRAGAAGSSSGPCAHGRRCADAPPGRGAGRGARAPRALRSIHLAGAAARSRTSSGCGGPGSPSRPPPPSRPRCSASSTPSASRSARATG